MRFIVVFNLLLYLIYNIYFFHPIKLSCFYQTRGRSIRLIACRIAPRRDSLPTRCIFTMASYFWDTLLGFPLRWREVFINFITGNKIIADSYQIGPQIPVTSVPIPIPSELTTFVIAILKRTQKTRFRHSLCSGKLSSEYLLLSKPTAWALDCGNIKPSGYCERDLHAWSGLRHANDH